MANLNRKEAEHGDVVGWRRDLHAHPELLYDVHRTAAFVAAKLREFGCDVVATGIGKTGVVGLVRGQIQASGKAIGLRADMDALAMEETSGVPWVSTIPGLMHACGHDGHTAMLLGAARQIAGTHHFNCSAVFIFRPAEEGGGGGKAMVDDGLISRFGIHEVYAMHTEPGLPIGRFATVSGPIGASADGFRIRIEGKGAHGASPHAGIDPLVVGANIILALQTIVSRNVDPINSEVVSVASMNGGKVGNVIPQFAELGGMARTFDPSVRDLVEQRVIAIAEKVAEAAVTYKRIYPPTVNRHRETVFALDSARTIVGEANVNPDLTPLMGSEDFAFMLEACPGNIMLIGNGDRAGLHDPRFDSNDAAIPFGFAYFRALIERGMPL